MNTTQALDVLRVGFIHYPTMFNRQCGIKKHYINPTRPDCGWPGIAVEAIQLIVKEANMILEPVFAPPDYPDPWEWAHTSVYNGTVDTVALAYEKTEKRKALYDFSVPLYRSNTRLAVLRSDSSLTSMFDFFTVYSPASWLALGVSFLAFAFFGLCVHFIEYKLRLSKKLKPGETLWSLIRLQLRQYNGLEFRLKSGSTGLVIFSLLQCVILLSLYQSYIISSVVRYRDTRPFKSSELLTQLQTKKYSLITITKYDWLYEIFYLQNDTEFYEYRKTLEYNPMVAVETEKEALELANKGGHVLVFQDDDLVSYEVIDYCDLVVLDSPWPAQTNQYLIFTRGYPHQERINDAILKQTISIVGIYRRYAVARINDTCVPKTYPIPLSIHLYWGVLILFLSGSFTAIFAFGLEYFKRRWTCRIKIRP